MVSASHLGTRLIWCIEPSACQKCVTVAINWPTFFANRINDTAQTIAAAHLLRVFKAYDVGWWYVCCSHLDLVVRFYGCGRVSWRESQTTYIKGSAPTVSYKNTETYLDYSMSLLNKGSNIHVIICVHDVCTRWCIFYCFISQHYMRQSCYFMI